MAVFASGRGRVQTVVEAHRGSHRSSCAGPARARVRTHLTHLALAVHAGNGLPLKLGNSRPFSTFGSSAVGSSAVAATANAASQEPKTSFLKKMAKVSGGVAHRGMLAA